MKIQLDAKALEWLWTNAGGQFQFELQSAVTQWFGSKFLKGVLVEDFVINAQEDVKASLAEESAKLQKFTKNSIDNFFNNVRKDFWQEIDHSVLEVRYKNIKDLVRFAIEQEAKKVVQEKVEKVLSDLSPETIKDLMKEEIRSFLKEKYL